MIAALRAGAMKPEKMITRKVRIDRIAEDGFKPLIEEKDKHIKILVDLKASGLRTFDKHLRCVIFDSVVSMLIREATDSLAKQWIARRVDERICWSTCWSTPQGTGTSELLP